MNPNPKPIFKIDMERYHKYLVREGTSETERHRLCESVWSILENLASHGFTLRPMTAPTLPHLITQKQKTRRHPKGRITHIFNSVARGEQP